MGPDDVRELFAGFGPVTVRRLFGGAGVYSGNTMFALVHDGVVYLKVDDGNLPGLRARKSSALHLQDKNRQARRDVLPAHARPALR